MATPHIESNKEDIAKVILMPGDPLRAKYIAENFLTNYKVVNTVRNMLAYTGYYKDNKITVFASGMGIPSIGIYAYELYKFYDVEKIIRIGTCGAYSMDSKVLDIVLSKSSYSLSDFSKLMFNKDEKEIESTESLNKKIIDTAKNININIKYGKTITSDVFDLYSNVEDFRSLFPNENYLSCEMEAYGLFCLAKNLNKEASCLMTVVDSLYEERKLTSMEREQSLNDMITLALESLI